MRKENEFHDVEIDVVKNELKVLKNFKLFFDSREWWEEPDYVPDVWVGEGDGPVPCSNSRSCEEGGSINDRFPGGGGFPGGAGDGAGEGDGGGYYITQQEADRRAVEEGLQAEADEYNSNLVYEKDSEGMFEYDNRQHVWEYRHTREDLLTEIAGLTPTGTDERFKSAYAHLQVDKHENVYAKTYTAPTQDREGQWEGQGELGWDLVDTPSMREMEGYKSYINVANDLYKSAEINHYQKIQSLQIGAAPGAIEGEGGQRRSSAGPRQVRPV